MIKENLIYKNSIRKEHLSIKFSKKLRKTFKKRFNKIIENIDTHENTFHMFSKKFKLNFTIKELKKFNKFKTIIILGMGGSILGANAVYETLNKKIKKKFYFLDNIDENKIINIKKNLEISKTLFLIISKSGNTTETLSNFLSLNIIKKRSKNIIIISEKNNNILYKLAKKFDLFFVEHKNYIGGRYSILSEVGLIPAYLMGLNINYLRQNLTENFNNRKKKYLEESSTKLANLYLQKKNSSFIFLNYVPQLEKFLYWYQQLLAESLGKKGMGMLPVVSSVPKDHHSLLQLYLDGPKDKIFHIFSLQDKSNKIFVRKKFNETKHLHNKSLNQIKNAQRKALLISLKKNKIPFRETIIKKFDEKTIGELFVYFILETAIIGKLIGINPFNQPAVEQVKFFTKKILK